MPCTTDDIPCDVCGEQLWGKPCENCARLKKKAAKPTIDMLCEACELLDEAKLLDKASKKLRSWYKDHYASELDRIRLEAAEKLTERERKSLGIDIKTLRKQNKK